MLLDYVHTYPAATIRYHTRYMCLYIDSDAVYLVQPRALIRVAGHFYLSKQIATGNSKPSPKPNGPILTECRTVRNVISSAAAAEIIGIHHNNRLDVPIKTVLIELGHSHPPTTIRIDNSTSHRILTSTIRQKRPKAFDINIYWIEDRIKRGQFYLFLNEGTNNKVDKFTKQLPPKHHE